MTFNFLFDVACLVIDELIFGAQQVVKGFWFLGLLFCGVGVVCCLCGYCFIILQATYVVVGKIL
jgi:Na+/H+-translocating membrane pyrophosphatase